MGCSESVLLPPLPSENFFCITFVGSDTIILFYASQQEIDICRQAILKHCGDPSTSWRTGVQADKVYVQTETSNLSCHRFKINGTPFSNTGLKSSMKINRMAAKILVDLHNIGWKLTVSSSLARLCAASTWFFERQVVKKNSQAMFSIALISTDLLQINDCPPNILKILRDIITKVWVHGVQKDKAEGPGTHLFKLKGMPWWSERIDEPCLARHLIREIISVLSNNKWVLYGTGNFDFTTDTLFFMYDETQVPEQKFSTISLSQHDCLRLIAAPDEVVNAVDTILRLKWKIQEVIDERPFCYGLQLYGSPWYASGSAGVASRRLIVSIMEQMASIGYYPINSLKISQKFSDKPLLLFKKGAPMQANFFCLSLNSTDKIRIINAPPNVTEAGKKIISSWKMGLQREKMQYDGVSYQAKLKGKPWFSLFIDGCHARALLLALWSSFHNLGWRLVCSADVCSGYVKQSRGPDYLLDAHSWFFMYDGSLLASQDAEPPPSDIDLHLTSSQQTSLLASDS